MLSFVTDSESIKGGSVKIINFRHNEDLITGSDQFNHDKDRRNVFCDRTEFKVGPRTWTLENIWFLEKVKGICIFKKFN